LVYKALNNVTQSMLQYLSSWWFTVCNIFVGVRVIHPNNYVFVGSVGMVDATGAVEITNSFTVPHNEVGDEVSFYQSVNNAKV